MPSPVAAGAVKPGAAALKVLPEGQAMAAVRPTKLFIGGITRNTTTKQLRDHFSLFGRVLDCVSMRQPDGRPRGFGYVTLDSPQAADRCMAQPQVIDGRVVDMKRAVPEGDMDSAPTARLHTPSNATARALPSPTGLLSTPGPVSPSSVASRTAAAGWPFGAGANLGLSAAGLPGMFSPAHAAAAAAAAVQAAALSSYSQHWAAAAAAAAAANAVPDCMELLSTGATQQTAPTLLSTRPPVPQATTPALLSASAPEFVPAAVPTARPEQRSVLGEITNTVGKADKVAAKPLKKAEADSLESLILSVATPMMRQAPRLQIDTDAIFEDSQSNGPLSPAGLEIHVDKEDNENRAPTDSDDGEESCNELPAGPLPSLGSADHAAGTCKRCNFFPKGRCASGKNCTFCHLPHDKRKASRQEKRERKSQMPEDQENIWVNSKQDDFEENAVEKVMAYSMFPGMPPMQTTKLPTPLALPGNVMPCFSSSPVAPPPGLTQQHCFGYPQSATTIPWQPDEEVSPMCAQTPVATQVATMTSGAFLSTVPVSPNAAAFPVTQPMSVQTQAKIAADAEPKKVTMVTMATQTEEEEEEQAKAAGNAISRETMLQFRRVAVGLVAGAGGLRAEAK